MPINANVSGGQQITASVGETQIDVSVSGGVGPTGTAGAAASVTVGTVTTGAPGSSASVVNAGTSSAAILNFTIPAGATGAPGQTGAAGAQGIQGIQGIQGPAGPAGATGATGPAGSNATATTDASALVSGTLDAARLPGSVVLTTDARLSDARQPLTHQHTASQISDFTSAVVAAAPPTTNASLLTSGTIPDARISSAIARTADVSSAVAAVVNAAPAALDTLNELAAALGNDASFATTVTNSLAGKAALVHTHTVSAISDAGTAATRNVPATGNAGATEVVLGGDTRLTDQRVPTDGSVTTAKLGSLTSVSAGTLAAGSGGISTIGTIRQNAIAGTAQFSVSTSGVVTVGAWQATAIAVAFGGTGATDAAGARTNLGLVLGTDVPALSHTHSAQDVSGLAAVATSGVYSDLTGRPTLGTAAAAATGDFAAASHTHGNITNAGVLTGAVTGGGGGSTDPDFANVSLLLSMDGNGNTFVDSSGTPKTITANGSATQSTAESKFGGKSAFFDGSSRLSAPASLTNLPAGTDFTVEAWVYPTSTAQGGILGSGTIGSLCFGFGSGKLFLSRANIAEVVASENDAIVANQWQHVAATRSGNAMRLFINGTQVGSVTQSVSFPQPNALSVGHLIPEPDWYYSGYIDELRITSGVARYTANFTPPAAAFPFTSPPVHAPLVVTNSSGVIVPAAQIPAAAVSGLSAVASSGSAADLTGTLADARLSANVVLTNDTRLASNGNKGDITVSGSGATWAINAGAIVTADLSDGAVTTGKIADSAVTDAKVSTVAASKLTGTVALARLPVVLEQTQTVGNSGTTRTLALTTGSVQTVTLNANCTFTMPAATAGASITLILTQGGTFTATFTGVLWSGGAAPTITATANRVDVLVFVSNGASWFGTAAQNF